MAAFDAARDFLAGRGLDHRGRSRDDILGWPDDRLEAEHDFIQWLFPLDQPSPVNPWAPVPTPAQFAALAEDPAVRAGALAACRRMLSFYGLERTADGRVVKAAHWGDTDWARWPTHNDRRLSRMLRSLSLLGLRDEACALLTALEALMAECRDATGRAEPLRHWRAAVSAERPAPRPGR
ncbi:MAG: opioid growth factor receptor-related protein [Betaproteobacteria bacterium]